MVFAYIFTLIFFRFVSIRAQSSCSQSSCCVACVMAWVRRFRVLSTFDTTFYGLLGFTIYCIIGKFLVFIHFLEKNAMSNPDFVGPWSIGYFVDGHIGAVFLWGLITQNTYVSDRVIYVNAFFQVINKDLFHSLVLYFSFHKLLFFVYSLFSLTFH